jgi:hypothetical protein
MGAALSRRLALLEAQQGNTFHRMHIVMATHEDYRQRQVAESALNLYFAFTRL